MDFKGYTQHNGANGTTGPLNYCQSRFYEYLKPQTLFSIDINKCRKNILYYGKIDYCVFTVFDKVDEFNSTKIHYQPKNNYNKFIDYCYKNIKDYSKLAINSMIGIFKPNLNKRERWNSKTFTSNSCEAVNTYLINKGCFIDVKSINNTEYYLHSTKYLIQI